MTIKTKYKAALASGAIVADEAQRKVVDKLADLQQEIVARDKRMNRLWHFLSRKTEEATPRGIYLWGGVGRGKTFLMDIFFDSLETRSRKRIHFHRMMSDVHARLKAITDTEDPLDIVAADIAAESSILCLDEFFVSDIGDAMILSRLLDGLFRRGVTLVATSNARPSELYRDGLQRQRFLPAITALERFTEVTELDGGTDYRLRLFREAGTFLTPTDAVSEGKLAHYFAEIASGEIIENRPIDIRGRQIQTRRFAKGVAWFDFAQICDGPRSQEDYIEIARWYSTVIISNVPALGVAQEDQARRLIALVDEFYDRKVKLVLSAASGIDTLYGGKRLQFEFQRTASRLTEMQSAEYLHAPHQA
jgi:cell division protein ZapE